MKTIVILGGGTAGTIVANKLARALDGRDWQVTVLDRDNDHIYQPGLLQVPFHYYEAADLVRSRRRYLDRRVRLLLNPAARIDTNRRQVQLASGESLAYDYLVIATGMRTMPEKIPGLAGPAWPSNVAEFYTLAGATRLQRMLESWPGGRLVINIAELPIRCPLAPLEFAFLADSFFRAQRMRLAVEIDFVTPLPAAFPQARVAVVLDELLHERRIRLLGRFKLERVNAAEKHMVDAEGRIAPFDLLVTVPPNVGQEVIAGSGLGDERNLVITDRQTLLAKRTTNVFALGDATDLPALKTVADAHFQAEVVFANLIHLIEGREPAAKFDGHTNCFVESGDGKALAMDFSYDVEALPGKFPLPGLGPISLLKETRLNHWGNLMFRWTYWNVLLAGRGVPVGRDFSLSGKEAATA